MVFRKHVYVCVEEIECLPERCYLTATTMRKHGSMFQGARRSQYGLPGSNQASQAKRDVEKEDRGNTRLLLREFLADPVSSRYH